MKEFDKKYPKIELKALKTQKINWYQANKRNLKAALFWMTPGLICMILVLTTCIIPNLK